jgi:hypothetical protein
VVAPDRAGLAEPGRLAQDGRLVPRIDRAIPLAVARQGYEALESGHCRGKIVLTVS